MDYFNNESDVSMFGDLMIENRLGGILISGSVEISKSEQGADVAAKLSRMFAEIAGAARVQSKDETSTAPNEDSIDNPFTQE